MQGSSSKAKCTSTNHRQLIDSAKCRLGDLQQRFAHIQTARNEGRTNDAAFLEEQVFQSLCEWKAELDTPSPANSLLGGTSLGSFSDDIARLLQLCDEQDDATSALAEPSELKPEPNVQSPHPANFTAFPMEYLVNDEQDQKFPGFDPCDDVAFDPCDDVAFDLPNSWVSNSDLAPDFDCHQLSLDQEVDHGFLIDENGVDVEGNQKTASSNAFSTVHLPSSAFMGPKCALWDCARPASGSEWYHDYCSNFHADVAFNEDPPGTRPVLQPAGIGIKDSLLFSALKAKSQGKNVGIPECGGAATTKSPWNAPELFDLSLCDGEIIREWLFFDKPRKAFESGVRKQRSLPDYSGRGWHESRKQVMKEFNGNKRSYYMDPQPSNTFEWHLFEYEFNGCDACALYRLEFKLGSAKKSPKVKVSKGSLAEVKVSKDSLADLQNKMGRLTAEFPGESEPPSVNSKAKASKKNVKNEGTSTNEIPAPSTGPNNHPSDDLADNSAI